MHKKIVEAVAKEQQLRAVIVDDERSVAILIQEMLMNVGVEAEATDDGMEALSRHEARPYDFALVDWAMPKMRGKELVEGLLGSNFPPKVIIMTGERLVSFNLDLSVECFLFKPFNSKDMFRCVAKAIGANNA